MYYRREIDGLRALAVLPVILFHAGFEAFRGGFVGVDVFFVISGYLITTIILTELEEGRFSIITFYERRARRILPALSLVMLASIPLAWICLMPSGMKDFSQSLVAVPVFASNIFFWRKSGYFDTSSELRPLLHTWSLAVEEQYYVLFPLLLLLFWKRGKRRILLMIGSLFFLSLAFAQWAAHANPAAAFFLLPTRGWELLLGSFAALYVSKPQRREFGKGLNELGGWLGLALILYAVFAFDKTTPFPGLYALIPTLGTVLIILFATQQTKAGKFIGNTAFVGLGLISYSAYLWHQPLFAFARHVGVGGFQRDIFLGLIVITFLLAYVSWRYIELPFRTKSLVSRKAIFAFAGVSTIGFVSLGLFGHKANGNVGQLTAEQKRFLEYFENDIPEWKYFVREGIPEKFRVDCDFYDIAKYRSGNHSVIPVTSISESCFNRKHEDSNLVFIWGDSHAQQLYYGLSKALPPNYELLQVASSACVARTDAPKNRGDYCEYSNWFAYDSIKKLKPEVVIVSQKSDHDFERMERMSMELKKTGVRRVLFIGPTPRWNPSLPAVVARLLPSVPNRSFSGIDKSVVEIDKKLTSIANGSTRVEYLSLVDYFCNKDGCLIHYDSNVAASITSWDYGHLTPIASYHLARDLLAPRIIGN